MPVDLHQRFSEFSYGYGATREVEELLKSVGLKTTPFLPSLLHEAKLGFDVAFDKPGAALMLQFKLGQAMQRFVRKNPATARPKLDKRFWRFRVDTAEENGQYDLLLKAEHAGAEVYYVAPQFSDWQSYTLAFECEQILDQSLLLAPSKIDDKLTSQGDPDGLHLIVYDTINTHVCSDPASVERTRSDQLGNSLEWRIEKQNENLRKALVRVQKSFDTRREIVAEQLDTEEAGPESDGVQDTPISRESPITSIRDTTVQRELRLTEFLNRAESEGDAYFAAVGMECWAIGSQLIAVTAD